MAEDLLKAIRQRVERWRAIARSNAKKVFRAEPLAALVNIKTADLLERLASHTAAHADSFADPNSSWTLLRRAEIKAARELAAQIREALDDNQA